MQSSRVSRLFLLLAAFAACVQWMIPHGWMVGSADDGPALLVPCPSTSPELASLSYPSASAEHDHHASLHASAHGNMGHGSGNSNQHGAAQAQCDFAALGAPVLPPDAPMLSAPPFATTDLLAAFPDALPGLGLAAPPPPSTGPPTSRA